MSRKARSDSKLDNLPELQLLELRDGLLKRTFKSYDEALQWLLIECGVDSSRAALSGFFKRHCAPLIKERRQYAAIRAEALGDAMESDPVNWDAAIIEKTKQLTFEFLDAEEVDADSIKKLLDAISKARGQELDERRVTLMEEKAASAKAKLEQVAEKEKSKGGISEETLREIEEAAGLL